MSVQHRGFLRLGGLQLPTRPCLHARDPDDTRLPRHRTVRPQGLAPRAHRLGAPGPGALAGPRGARETLIGVTAPLLAVTLTGLADRIAQILMGRPIIEIYQAPELLGDTAGMAAEIPHGIAEAMFGMMVVYLVLLVLRFSLRRDWATIAIVVTLLAPLLSLGPRGRGASVFVIAVLLIGAAVVVTTFAVVVIRTGLIATIVFLFVLKLLVTTPLTFDMSKFYAPQSVLDSAKFSATPSALSQRVAPTFALGGVAEAATPIAPSPGQPTAQRDLAGERSFESAS